MRWQRRDPERWHRWFAWYPVEVATGEWVWSEWVWRKKSIFGWGFTTTHYSRRPAPEPAETEGEG